MPNAYVVKYSESDYTGCLDVMKSTLEYVFTLKMLCISWISVRKTLKAFQQCNESLQTMKPPSKTV